MKNTFTKLLASLSFILLFSLQQNFAQVQRNPVIEACTGTWCQWCPCGHDIIDQIIHTMPNAIAIEYHGPANSSDPWDDFAGNEIIGLLSYTGYPTGVIDRTSAPQSRSAWAGLMNQRNSIPAVVDITMDKSYNKITRELDVTIHATAQEDLTDEYKLSFLILESGLVYGQTGNGSCPGAGSYIHNHVVRAMINGAQGEALNGANTWSTGQTISKDISYTVPQDYVDLNCELVAFVYKVASPLYLGEIAQGEKWPLTSPDFIVNLSSSSADVITANNTPAEYTTVIKNEGLLDDVYYVEGNVDIAGWDGEFTTPNGTFAFGETDSVEVAVGDSLVVSVSVNPNNIDGFGTTQIQFTSKGDPGVIALATLRTVTSTGIDILVADGSGEEFGSTLTSSLDNFYEGNYGVVSGDALNDPDADLSNFKVIMLTKGNSPVAFNENEVTGLQNYLDQNGMLFLTGQNIGKDVFDSTGQSQFAQDFYNNYLHAEYIADFGGSFFLNGITDDPISNGLAFPLNNLYDRSPDHINPLDADATEIFKFGNTTNYAGIKTDALNYRVVYLSFGIEQVDDAAIRDSIVSRSINWLLDGITVGVNNETHTVARTYQLNQNYPNPFNPTTRISYSVAEDVDVSLKIYDIMGAEVMELVNTRQPAGFYEVQFDAANLSSGMYFYELKAGDFVSVKKMTLLK
jgi:hypothetical protein